MPSLRYLFHRTLHDVEFTNQPVWYEYAARHKRWIEPAVAAESQHESQRVIYRMVFYWLGEKEEEQWVREFAECQYWILGFRARAVALMAEAVRGTSVSVRQERSWDFAPRKEYNSDEPMGF